MHRISHSHAKESKSFTEQVAKTPGTDFPTTYRQLLGAPGWMRRRVLGLKRTRGMGGVQAMYLGTHLALAAKHRHHTSLGLCLPACYSHSRRRSVLLSPFHLSNSARMSPHNHQQAMSIHSPFHLSNTARMNAVFHSLSSNPEPS